MSMHKDVTASRWARLMHVKAPLPPDHPFVILYTELVTAPALQARQMRSWTPMDPEGQLNKLESCAREHDLLPSKLPLLDPREALADLLLSRGDIGRSMAA